MKAEVERQGDIAVEGDGEFVFEGEDIEALDEVDGEVGLG